MQQISLFIVINTYLVIHLAFSQGKFCFGLHKNNTGTIAAILSEKILDKGSLQSVVRSLPDFAPELATGNWQLATHYLDAGSNLLVLKLVSSQ